MSQRKPGAGVWPSWVRAWGLGRSWEELQLATGRGGGRGRGARRGRELSSHGLPELRHTLRPSSSSPYELHFSFFHENRKLGWGLSQVTSCLKKKRFVTSHPMLLYLFRY